jgi:hypothetical protein
VKNVTVRAKRTLSIAPLLALAASMAYAAPAAAQGGTNGGNGMFCQPSSPQVVVQYSTPQRVSGSGGVQCAPVGAEAPGQFGPSDTRFTPTPPQAGTPCDLHFETPIQARLAGGTPEYRTLGPASSTSGQQIVVDPNSPPWQSQGFGSWSGDFVPGNISESLYLESGTYDLYRPWEFIGKWNGQGQCVGTTGVAGEGWRCGNQQQVCTDAFTPLNPPVGGPLPITALPFDLRALVQGQFGGGVISSLPAQPNPGLVNVPTCFYITGMTVTGGGDPLLDQWWEQIVQGPVLDEGRHIFYSFVIHVSYQQTVWDFGDGTSGGSSGQVPAACGNKPGQQFLVTHSYARYNTAGFQVRVTHSYTVDASEMWVDAAGPHVQDLGNQITIPVTAQPQPYIMPILQEEGVPIGG